MGRAHASLLLLFLVSFLPIAFALTYGLILEFLILSFVSSLLFDFLMHSTHINHTTQAFTKRTSQQFFTHHNKLTAIGIASTWKQKRHTDFRCCCVHKIVPIALCIRLTAWVTWANCITTAIPTTDIHHTPQTRGMIEKRQDELKQKLHISHFHFISISNVVSPPCEMMLVFLPSSFSCQIVLLFVSSVVFVRVCVCASVALQNL